MRYEKPVVMNLSAGARAAGQEPLGCYDGAAAGGPFENCWTGDFPAVPEPPCRPGSEAFPDCIGGTNAFLHCEAGTAGDSDPFGCREGPSVVLP